MKKAMLWLMMVVMFRGASSMHAQGTATAATPAPPAVVAHAPGDMAGDWQGTINPGREIRIVVRIAKGGSGWTGKMFVFGDQGAQPIDLSAVTVNGAVLKFAATPMGATFEGTASSDGSSMAGSFAGVGPGPMPVTLARATKENAWDIPAPPPPPKTLPADADPSFAVATIKPNPSGIPSMQRLTTDGHNFVVRNASLADLMSFAYDVQTKQIFGAPSWMDQDRYDIDARQDQDGLASATQLRNMVKKLLDERFQLKVHPEQHELPAFVLTVGKGGQKLTASQTKGPLPGMGFRPAPGGLMLRINNGTLDDLTGFLQSAVLDKPVVNHANIPGRFDISVIFAPDDSQFKGHPPLPPGGADATAEAAPSLFNAIEQQLGLKLSSEKAQVNVIAIDHVDHPSAN